MDVAIVNHLFLTQRFLVKGTVRTGELRLSSFLNTVRRPWLAVEDATFLEFDRPDRGVAKHLSLRLSDVLLAHEYLDLSGDPLRKSLAQSERDDFSSFAIHFRAPSRFELIGRIRREALESGQGDEFFVVLDPLLRGFEERDGEQAPDEVKALKGLNFAILNRAQVHAYFPYE
jgi:hypothetical protein